MKSLVRVHYGSKVPRQGAAVAHVQVDDIRATDAVVLVDTSNVVPQNAFFEKDIEISLTGKDLTYFVDKGAFPSHDRRLRPPQQHRRFYLLRQRLETSCRADRRMACCYY